MLSKIIVTAYNLFAIAVWTAVLVLTLVAAYMASTWQEFGDSYAEGSWLRLTVQVAQAFGVFDIIFAMVGWTRNGVIGPFLQMMAKLFTVFLVFPVLPKASEADTWLG